MQDLKMTVLRNDILSLFKKAEKPLKAYEVLERLKKIRPNAKPPTVYRVLDVFVKNNILHNIQSQHTYTLCKNDGSHDHQSQTLLLVCNSCSASNEIKHDKISKNISSISSAKNFQLTQSTVELAGLCANCQAH
jgi:Fur family transcriptional regulator, zinc uptake regulator